MTDNKNNSAVDPSIAALRARIAELESQQANMSTNKLMIKLSANKPSVASVYGLGRFPVSLHGKQWQRLVDFSNTITAFIAANPQLLIDDRPVKAEPVKA